MKYSAFEGAAAEASAGVKEIDAEINRLLAKRDLLERLAHQLLSVLASSTEAIPADGDDKAGAMPDDPAAQQPSYSNGVAEAKFNSIGQEEWPASSVAGSASEPDEAATEQPSYSDHLTQSKPYSLRNEGWPASSAVDQRGLRQLL
jgi:hypothetical protein